MKGINRVAIIGVGFMGGSLALAMRKKFPKLKVWGFARSQKSYRKLKKLGLLHRVEKDLSKLLLDADLVVFALPVKAISDYFKQASPFLKKGAIVLDLGSTKELIAKSAKKNLPKEVSFVGCHPLAGSEKSGAEFSRVNLYQNSLCLITSSKQLKATRVVKGLWQKIGCRVVFIGPKQHDKILCSISHLPHLISFSLKSLVSDNYRKFSMASFRDLTRIADSPAPVWADIFLSNKNNVLRNLRQYLAILKKFESSLKKSDKPGLLKLIAKANSK